MRVSLVEERVTLALEGFNGIGTGGEANRWLVQGGQLDQGPGELGGVASLLAVHALPTLDSRHGALGVVLDRGLRVLGGLRRKQFGTEETGLDKHRLDTERRN